MLLQDLDGNGALACDDIDIVVRMYEHRIPLIDEPERFVARIVVGVPVQKHLRAERANRLTLSSGVGVGMRIVA